MMLFSKSKARRGSMVEGDLGDEFAEKVTLEGTITYPTKLEKEYH